MGNMQALSMAGAVQDGDLTLEAALSWHFSANHFPPLPQELVPVAVDIIYSYDPFDADAQDRLVTLPEGITWRGDNCAPVWACIDAWHLDAYLEQFLYGDGEED